MARQPDPVPTSKTFSSPESFAQRLLDQQLRFRPRDEYIRSNVKRVPIELLSAGDVLGWPSGAALANKLEQPFLLIGL